MRIVTARLIIREWQEEDWVLLKPIATDPRVLRFVTKGGIPTDDQIRRFVQDAIKLYREEGFSTWPLMLRRNEVFIGFCGLDRLWKGSDIKIGYWLAPDYWSMGLATEAGQAVVNYGVCTLGLQRIVAIAHPCNLASIRVLEKLRFACEGNYKDETGEYTYFTRLS